jgi:hypothetical protein
MPIHPYFLESLHRPTGHAVSSTHALNIHSREFRRYVLMYIKHPDDATKKFTMFHYFHDNCLESREHESFKKIYITCPILLLEKIFKMMDLRCIFKIEKNSNGQTEITVKEISSTIDTYVSCIKRILDRTIFQISTDDANLIVQKLGIESNVYCIEECCDHCLVVLSPSLPRDSYDSDPKGQSWTRFKEEADMLIAKKSAAAATAASATVPESGK